MIGTSSKKRSMSMALAPAVMHLINNVRDEVKCRVEVP
jgi:hypothetical protein